MGFGSIIGTAIAIVVLMAAGYLLIGGVTLSADVTGASLKAAADLENQKLKTELVIDNVGSNASDNWFAFHLNNNGSTKIENITKMDVIVLTTGINSSAYYVPYRFPGEDRALYWTNESITANVAGIGDAMNPGMLDPGEYVNIIIHNDDGFPSNTAWVQVTTPNGVSAATNVVIT
ncbi:MAG: hypothetical protein A4E28_01849 [Methanocella sp. PtaU1.Bin125]|nr:MAG: hypothetical protein A4E28_01849 [Methanocella sp. PtaU1.Bin125]